MTHYARIALFSFIAALAATPALAQAQQTPSPAPSLKPPQKMAKPSPSPSPAATAGPPWSSAHWRNVGPALSGGRAVSVAGSSTDPNLYYVGSAGGGLWKSNDSGETWAPVFDAQDVSSIGAVAIDPNSDDVVWVGTGEHDPRNDVTYGDGVYKSIDGGKTFKRAGLEGTRQISRIAIDPRDSNHVVVGALGNVFGPGSERGVYVTFDGGKTWSKTLFVSDQSGASDVSMSSDGKDVYAGIWHFKREPWNFTSGGTDDGLYKSSDGGRTWTRLSGHGLPEGLMGKIAVAVAPSNSNRVYAEIESKAGVLWRSDDAGATWKMVSKDSLAGTRPFYFLKIAIDPKNDNKVYAISFLVQVSSDGGQKWTRFTNGVHADFHGMWIAPSDPRRVIVVEDGGFARTLDGGQTWFDGLNLPIGQVYHVGYSNENPYWLCGGWQDNNLWCGPNNSRDPNGNLNRYWIDLPSGDGESIWPEPDDANWIWGDSQNAGLVIYNKVTHDVISAQPYLTTALAQFDPSKAKYRFNWDAPIAFAPWGGHTAWVGGNAIFQSTDRGYHWKVISPDLTRNVKAHQQPPGGPIALDSSGAEISDTILDIEGSTLAKGEIWTGSDDGIVGLTRDGGKHWTKMTLPGAPEFGRVETVAPSTLHDGTAYANVDAHKTNDIRPYVYVTHDFGAHWENITGDLPQNQYVRSVRPDLHNPNIVYAGTENGMWISFSGGRTWHDFKNNLPPVSVRDIRIQPRFDDLLIATHGRALWVMDDLRAIEHLNGSPSQAPFLIAPRTSYQYTQHSDDEEIYTQFSGDNPPGGAVVRFYQSEPMKKAPEMQFLDASRHVVRTVKGTHKVNGKDVPYITNKAGINQYVWDYGTDGPVKWTGAARAGGANEGPQVPPGRYLVRMTLAGKTYTEPFTVAADPHTVFTQGQMVAAYTFAQKYFREYSIVNTMLNGLDEVKKTLDTAKADPKLKADAGVQKQIESALAGRETLFASLTENEPGAEAGLQHAGRLREDLGSLMSTGFPLTQPVIDFGHVVDGSFRNAVLQYDAYVKSLAPLEKTLGRRVRPEALKP